MTQTISNTDLKLVNNIYDEKNKHNNTSETSVTEISSIECKFSDWHNHLKTQPEVFLALIPGLETAETMLDV
jgi:hypothetical protein